MAFPTTVQRLTDSTSVNATTYAVVLPTFTAGNMALVFVSSDSDPVLSTSSTGWSIVGAQKSDASPNVTGVIFKKYPVAGGLLGDPLVISAAAGSVSTGSEQFSSVTLEFSHASALNVGTTTGASGTSTNSNPPSLTPSGGTQDYTFIASRHGDSTVVATAAPASYSSLQTIAGGGAGASTNTAERQLTGTTDDPGTFTSANEQWVALTAAVWGAGAAPATIAPVDVADGYVYDGYHATPTLTISGTRTAGTNLEREIFLKTAGTIISAYTSTGITYPTSTTFLITITGLAIRTDGDDYRCRIRDAADTANIVTVGGNFGPGFVFAFNEQSTFNRLNQGGAATGAPSSVSANNVRVMYPTSQLVNSGVTIARITAPNTYGSGYAELASAVGDLLGGATHAPIMIVDNTWSGETIDNWVADEVPPLPSGTVLHLISDTSTFMLGACQNRVTAWMRGAVLGTNVATNLDTLFGLFDAITTNQPATAPVYLLPCERQNDDSSWDRRQVLVDKIATGGRWKLAGWALDTQKDLDGSRHPATGDSTGGHDGTAAAHIAGNRRQGARFGLLVASIFRELFGGTAIDRLGPQPVSAQFITDLTAFDVTWSQDIETPSTHTTSLPQHWWSINSWTGKTEGSAAIISARVTRVTKVGGGTWSLSDTNKFAYIRDDPWNTTSGANGTEVNIRSKLDDLLYNTTSIESGRGVPAAPNMGTGITIQAPANTALPIRKARVFIGFLP